MNGCDARDSVFGFCISTVPALYQGSPAAEEWSHVVVGETAVVRGAIPVYTSGKPSFPDVFIKSPSGAVTRLPVGPHGGYSQSYTFSEQGEYAIGQGTWSAEIPGVPFVVAYAPKPPPGLLLSHVFPSSLQSWPDITVIAVPFGQTGSVRVRFLDALGHPAKNVQLWGTKIQTDSGGVATIHYDTTQKTWPLTPVYPDLFLQTVLHVSIAGGRVTGLWPQQYQPTPIPVRTIRANGVWMADVADFLENVGLGLPTQSGSVLTFVSGETIRLDTKSGQITVSPPPLAGSERQPQGPITVHPIVRGGQVYLSLSDMAKIVNLAAWAQPQPDGSLLLTEDSAP